MRVRSVRFNNYIINLLLIKMYERDRNRIKRKDIITFIHRALLHNQALYGTFYTVIPSPLQS